MTIPSLFALEEFKFTVDNTIHIGEIFALLAGARWIFSAGLALRDAVKDIRRDVDDHTDDLSDHENRIRTFEGKPHVPQRRKTDRQNREVLSA